MCPKFQDITNQKFAKLLVLEVSHKDKFGMYHWKCKCDCGGTKTVRGPQLKCGATTSCGCRKKEGFNTKHGGCTQTTKSKLYSLWAGIKMRCCNPRSKNYHNYGGRGITLWKDWRFDFACFRKYVLESIGYPPENKTLDRVDNNKGYEPGNLRWATQLQQCINRGKNRNIKTTSIYKGVGWRKDLQKWRAYISNHDTYIHIGHFDTEEEAAHAYNDAAILYHGPDANLNIL